MKKSALWYGPMVLALTGAFSAYATCSGPATLIQVATSSTSSPLVSGDDDLVEVVPTFAGTFSVTASSGHCGFTCAGASDSDYPTSSTYSMLVGRLINTSGSAADREVGQGFPGTAPSLGTEYMNVVADAGQTCTCTEGSYSYVKACVY